MNTSELQNLLRARYPRGEYAYFEELPDATGSNKQRTADAFVMSLWPSRGLWTGGFELKVSRPDFLRELKQPQKAERIFCYCDYWWLVVGDESIVQTGELPETWGLMAPRGGKLKVLKEAPLLEPRPISDAFLASILRHAQGQINPEAELKRVEDAGYSRGLEVGIRRAQVDFDRLKADVEAFEKGAGVSLRSWELGCLTEAVRLVKANKLDHYRATLASIRRQALMVAEQISVED